ncbi:LacI family DNA-binding transcriptional regulator [Cerasicoccus frondis]|uniref:LacI family DNA-binding transcriptional regulator n=1 Tax=Cerasicoccus frondis TaxID=490090 RepID=UPI002852805D|nr:LacI family DNA-binding transcriptional regulator [Cerasicoccus frondis]
MSVTEPSQSPTARVTMKDIADKAGVSSSTVCRALNSNPQIPEKTRNRIKQVAESLGYRPDPLLSAFASRRRGRHRESDITTIAYLSNFSTRDEWRDNPFYQRCHAGAQARLEEMGYKLEHFWLGETGMTGARLSKILYSRGILGLFVAPIQEVRQHIDMDWSLFSSITVGYSFLKPNIHRSAPHHFHGIQESLRQLHDLGYKRVGLCLFSETSRRVDELWFSGALVAENRRMESVQGKKRDFSVMHYLFNDETLRDAPEWCRRNKLDVVISDNLIVKHELESAGFSVPGDVDFATLNWEEEHPEVAGIDQRARHVGASAMDMMIGAIQRGERGVPEVPLTTMVEGVWKAGASLTRA